MSLQVDISYRRGVGIFLISKQKKIWVGKRIDSDSYWQMPQGGIDSCESELHAMRRELKEETGIENIKILASTEKWLKYDLPSDLRKKTWDGKYKGQIQKWYACQFLGQDTEININEKKPEFKDWKWVSPQSIIDHVIPFKKKMYLEILESFKIFYY